MDQPEVRNALKGMQSVPLHPRAFGVGWVPADPVKYVRAERFAGETKYPLKKMLKFAMDGVTSFSYLPLQLATYLGFFAAGPASTASSSP